MPELPALDLDTLDFQKGNGVVTVVTQDAVTGAVLMTAQADREALQAALDTGEMHYRSRSRGLWRKGATSGNVQRVISLAKDCDSDAVLARVISAGPACHTGSETCFVGEAFGAVNGDVLSELDQVIQRRSANQPIEGGQKSYTAKLLNDRNLRLKKLGEEASELVVACADGDPEAVNSEAADLIYHTLVAVRASGGSLDGVRRVLRDRR